MNVFTTDKIRNVVLLGHSGAGKTSLIESVAYLSGMIHKPGTIEAGNTISDYDKLEIANKFSINTSVVPIEWNDTKVNFLDTPGYFEFIGEVEEAVSAADGAIILISGNNGIEVGTKKAWEICERFHIPRMFFVTDMDVDKASYREIVEGLQALYGKKIAPFHFPIRENEEFVGYVNVIQQTGKRWKEDGTIEHVAVPDYSQEYLEEICDDIDEKRHGYRWNPSNRTGLVHGWNNPYDKDDPMYYTFLYEPIESQEEDIPMEDNVARGIDFLKKRSEDDNPFMLYLPISMTHPPYNTLEQFHNMYDPD